MTVLVILIGFIIAAGFPALIVGFCSRKRKLGSSFKPFPPLPVTNSDPFHYLNVPTNLWTSRDWAMSNPSFNIYPKKEPNNRSFGLGKRIRHVYNASRGNSIQQAGLLVVWKHLCEYAKIQQSKFVPDGVDINTFGHHTQILDMIEAELSVFERGAMSDHEMKELSLIKHLEAYVPKEIVKSELSLDK